MLFQSSPTRIAYGSLLAAAILWGMIGILAKGILAAGAAPLEIVFWRTLLAGGAFLLHALVSRQLHIRTYREGGLFLAVALLGIGHYASFILAVEHGGAALAAVLLALVPALTAVAARVWLREKLSAQKLCLVALSGIGLVLLTGVGGGLSPSGPSLGWGGLACITMVGMFIFDKRLLGTYSPVAINALLLSLAALLLAPWITFGPKAPYVWTLLLILAFVSTYCGNLLYYAGLKAVEASRAALVISLEPVVGTLAAVLLLGEGFGLLGAAGAGLILATTLGVVWTQVQQSRLVPTPAVGANPSL